MPAARLPYPQFESFYQAANSFPEAFKDCSKTRKSKRDFDADEPFGR
jgi:hypothetical protein